MADIVLTTLNAKYIHAAFGLRYLLANLGDLRPSAALVEFDINQRPLDIAEMILAREPKIIGFGVYIWNVAPTTEVVTAIKRLRPEIKIILGGPEVSYETEGQTIVQLADHIITGEADLKFAEVCRGLLNRFHTLPRPPRNERGEGRGEGLLIEMASSPQPSPPLSEEREKTSVPLPKIIPAEMPDFSKIILPYDLYTDDDLAHRIIYVEASRGCPFTCEFCLSSLDIPVRQVPLPAFLDQMQRLLDRGVKQFKFVDRTFNLNVATSRAILEFFLTRHQPGHFYHFEMIPDRLPAELREIIARFPPGTLQFEVGIQTFNPEVGALISRRQNCERLENNFNFLRRETGVHIHADLIVGLPGESLESFGTGFDRLIALGPQEIQVGILKRLRGTPIVRHDTQWQMVYSANPPYEILQNRLIDFATIQRLRRFAKYWDMVGNSGNFLESAPLIWNNVAQASRLTGLIHRENLAGGTPALHSPFHAFLRWSDWLYAHVKRTDSIALLRLMELLFEFLTVERQLDPKLVAETLWRDYKRGGRHDKPGFMKDFLSPEEPLLPPSKTKIHLPKRQARHLV